MKRPDRIPAISELKRMPKGGAIPLREVLPLVLLVFTSFSVIAQPKPLAVPAQQPREQEVQPEKAENQRPVPGTVTIEGRQILSVYEPVAGFDPAQRARKIADRIVAVAQERNVAPESVTLHSQGAWTEIGTGGRILMAVTDGDAQLAGKPREQLASEDAASIRKAIVNYRRDHSWEATLRSILYAALVTALVVPIAFVLRKLRIALRHRMERWIEARSTAAARRTALHVSVTYGLSLIVAVGGVLRWVAIIALFQVYFTVMLSFFPFSRPVSHAITGQVLSVLVSFGRSCLGYLPNVGIIFLILVFASQLFRLMKMIFDELGRGSLSIPGFYADWASPTLKLVRIAMLVLVLIVVFPYLPGSRSPAFQGISIFLGVLLSLGSSSAVANAIAGVILTYMRSLAVGDWVKIGDTLGEVVEKNLLVTRIITPKHEVITIPNSGVMSGPVMNFTREAKSGGVIFHTTATIGYNAPWKTVHRLLIEAARATEGILQTPSPFVLQTALNDFYVTYELNAYTDTPREMQFIYSRLHQNIQDKFNEAGVEICSPHFSALRDGNTTAIPEQYLPHDYAPPAFRIDGAGKRVEEPVAHIR